MALITALAAESVYLAGASATENHITANPNTEITFFHTGLESDGTTADTDPILLATAASITASMAAGAKYPLLSGQYVIMSGSSAYYFVSDTGGTPMLAMSSGPSNLGVR